MTQQEFADKFLKARPAEYCPEACQDAIDWLKKHHTVDGICDLNKAWKECPYEDWMRWTLLKLGKRAEFDRARRMGSYTDDYRNACPRPWDD